MITGCVRASAVCACKWEVRPHATVDGRWGAELAARGGNAVRTASLTSAELGCAYL